MTFFSISHCVVAGGIVVPSTAVHAIPNYLFSTTIYAFEANIFAYLYPIAVLLLLLITG